MHTASSARLRRIRRSTVRWLLLVVGALLLTLLVGSAIVHLYTEYLWYSALGYVGALWTRISTQIAVRTVTGAIGAGLVLINLLFVARHMGPVHLRRRYGNLEIAEQVPRAHVRIGIILVALLAGWWISGIQFGGRSSLAVLAWLRSDTWGVADPLFGNDFSFYVFGLPVLEQFLGYLLLVLVWTALLAGLGYTLLGAIRLRDNRMEVDEGPRFHFALLLAAFVVVLGVHYWLGRYGVLLEGSGFGGTVGYADVYARLPARTIIALLAVATAGAIAYGATRRNWRPALVASGILFLASIIGGVIYPAAVQKLQVEPNQLERERVYIDWLIEYTRRGFGLDEIQRRSWDPARRASDMQLAGIDWLGDVTLWDREQLQTAFAEETRRQYYEFSDVDFDRYMADGRPRHVAIAVREFRRSGLPADRQTWRNIHLAPTYTHGIGAVVTLASEAARGNPVYWLTNADTVERDALAPADLELTEPRVYFGETMEDYVVLNPEADTAGRVAPLEAVTTGIQLDSFIRILAFSWRFGDKNLLFSTERDERSRLLFRRPVVQRVRQLAPFLAWDDNAYPVIHDGRVVWFIDGYSSTANLPLSEPLAMGNGSTRYLRNSAKALVDAVSGEVTIYALDADEPLLATYRRIFPRMVQPLSEMPASLQAHLRYPPALAAAQADKLARFHVTEADVFYSGQSAWQRPQQGSTQAGAYQPLFMMAALPGQSRPEFLLSTPFIAADRQTMAGLLLVRNDPQHYGEAVLLELPSADVTRGPSQIIALIEQDAGISAQFSLWRSPGVDLQLGQLRVIPLDSAVLHVVPLYLSATGTALPQLQQVIVSDGVSVSMAPTLASAISGLGGGRTLPARSRPQETPAMPAPWAAEALRLQQAADRALRDGDFAAFGRHWTELQELLRRVATQPLPPG